MRIVIEGTEEEIARVLRKLGEPKELAPAFIPSPFRVEPSDIPDVIRVGTPVQPTTTQPIYVGTPPEYMTGSVSLSGLARSPQ